MIKGHSNTSGLPPHPWSAPPPVAAPPVAALFAVVTAAAGPGLRFAVSQAVAILYGLCVAVYAAVSPAHERPAAAAAPRAPVTAAEPAEDAATVSKEAAATVSKEVAKPEEPILSDPEPTRDPTERDQDGTTPVSSDAEEDESEPLSSVESTVRAPEQPALEAAAGSWADASTADASPGPTADSEAVKPETETPETAKPREEAKPETETPEADDDGSGSGSGSDDAIAAINATAAGADLSQLTEGSSGETLKTKKPEVEKPEKPEAAPEKPVPGFQKSSSFFVPKEKTEKEAEPVGPLWAPTPLGLSDLAPSIAHPSISAMPPNSSASPGEPRLEGGNAGGDAADGSLVDMLDAAEKEVMAALKKLEGERDGLLASKTAAVAEAKAAAAKAEAAEAARKAAEEAAAAAQWQAEAAEAKLVALREELRDPLDDMIAEQADALKANMAAVEIALAGLSEPATLPPASGFGIGLAPPAPPGDFIFDADGFDLPAPPPLTTNLFGPPAEELAVGGLNDVPAAAGGFFGAAAPAAGGLFGGLFGAAPAAPAAGGLFGAPAAAPASEGLFGAPANPFGTLDDMLDAAEKKVMPPDSNPFGVSRSEGAFGTPPPPAPAFGGAPAAPTLFGAPVAGGFAIEDGGDVFEPAPTQAIAATVEKLRAEARPLCTAQDRFDKEMTLVRDRLAGEKEVRAAYTALKTKYEPESADLKDPFEAELAKVIGMDAVKQQLRALRRRIKIDKLKATRGLVAEKKPAPHFVFRGNPGTGKTTFARLVGKLLAESGVVARDKVVEVQRSDLVAEYIGQTAQKTKAKINEARGGVLFIDEAYTLCNGGDKDFGREAIEEIMRVMNDGDPCIIVAGYPAEMETFLSANPGLARRFKGDFTFADYTSAELAQMVLKRAETDEFRLGPGIDATFITSLLEVHTSAPMRSKHNGGLVDDLFRHASDSLYSRIDPDDAGTCGDELITLEKFDLSQAACML